MIERGLSAAAKLQGMAGMHRLFASLQGCCRLGEGVFLYVLGAEQSVPEADRLPPSQLQAVFEVLPACSADLLAISGLYHVCS